MWSRDEDNLLLQNSAITMSLNDFTPKRNYFWDLVVEETPGLLPEECRERYIPSPFLEQLTWVFLRISVGRVP